MSHDNLIASSSAPLRLLEVVFPGDTNHHGTLFGGSGLGFMDRIAFICATRFGRVPFVTASFDKIDFRAPAKMGQLVEFTAKPIRAGRKSLLVEVEMVAENLVGGERQLCTTGTVAMVAVPPKTEPEWHLPALQPEVAFEDDGILRMTDVVFADQSNSFGKMFGGEALAQMTKAAFIAATRKSGNMTVLASSERVDFLQPVEVGSIIDAFAQVREVGNSSVKVEVELWSEALISGERVLNARGIFNMVSVDRDNRPKAIEPKL